MCRKFRVLFAVIYATQQQTPLTFLHNKMLHLPTVIGRPFLYHSTFKFESVTGSNLHSKWACCPSLMLSKLFGLVRKRGLTFTTSSTYSDFLYREESSKYWIFSKPDGCWESRIRSFLAETWKICLAKTQVVQINYELELYHSFRKCISHLYIRTKFYILEMTQKYMQFSLHFSMH